MSHSARKTVARKTAPGVTDGRVDKKNHWGPTDDPFKSIQPEMRIEQRRPGWGYRHVVSRSDVQSFLEIVPEWEKLSEGIDLILLAPGRGGVFGTYWHGYTDHGVIYLRAWPTELHESWSDEFFQLNREVVERLRIPFEKEEDRWELDFTEETARAFMLVDILLHEIGHHHDRMRTRSKKQCAEGEKYAERFAHELRARVWPEYVRRFRL